ncbi:L-rhamnose mutarotase [Paraflavisolibacter sp. H34]|uniref:L-rhamnose mutarotase n=1 Tax=Huijunlia imazamoxiresistens TaxID=3127457 RepID=UPI00301855DA
MMKRYCLALDLVDDPVLIAAYEHWHQRENGWPEIRQSILDAGIASMEIYRTGNRLLMVLEANEHFCFNKKAAMDAANPRVRQWEELMGKFQQPLPWAKQGEKWTLMEMIFQL